MGGEITWKCLPNGQFQFTMKFYRDCNGISGPASVTLQTNHPVGNIPCNKIAQNDISPDGILYNGTGTCATCAQGGTPAIPGLVEEFIYQSAPITLAGVPPAAGWYFQWGTCCRSASVTNLINPGSEGFLLRALMFPYNGQNTSPCFDSSPFFAERPSTIICTGYPYTYNHNAIDPEQDSLVYSWGQPLDDNGTALPFAGGYSVNSQLPGPIQNPSNQAITLDPHTGELNYLSYTGGYFATVLKVTAYKCGIKVAEIFREINVVLNSNCPPTMAGVQNLPPNVNAPFYDPVTGLQTSYQDTVYAGDTVNFFLNATDFDFFQNGTNQTITIEASGNQFGTSFTNPNAGCLLPPCATLTQTVPFSFPIAGGVGFNWVTTCDHVAGINSVCFKASNTYTFVIKATDNYCPANASKYSTISITVLPPPVLAAPKLRCASVNNDGSVSLSWTKSTPIDTQATFHSYDVYASLAAAGPWTLVDSVKTGFNTQTYTHSAASMNTFFGTNAQQQSIYYHIKTRSGCTKDSVSLQGNVLRTIKLNTATNANIEAVLTWNALSTPPLSSHNSRYLIYKSYPLGSPWVLLDSAAALTYTDTTTKQICDDYVAYRVDLRDSTGCVSKSSIDTLHVINNTPSVAINPVNPAFCQGGNVVLSASPSATYQWNTGATTQSITVASTGTYTVSVTQAGGCTATNSTTVTVNPNPIPNITGINVICQGQSTTFNAGAYSSFSWSTGATTQNIIPLIAGTYTVTVTDSKGCTGTDTHTLTINSNPVPVIAGNFTICSGQNTTLNAGGYPGVQWSTGATTQTISVGTAGPFTVTVTNGNGCTGTATQGVTVNPLPTPTITGTTSICQGTNTTLDAGAGYSAYQWSTGAAAQTINVSTTTTVTVTVTDAKGCKNSDTESVVVNQNPTPNITGINAICQGQNTTFNAGAYSSYNWSTGATTQTVSLNTAGNYTVTVTDANGCTGTDNYTLTVYNNPVPVIAGNFTICSGQNTTLNAGGYPGFQWSTGATTQTISVGTAGPFTVTVTNANGCSGSTSQAVTVNALPTPTITGVTSICQGTNTTLDAGAGYSAYQWSTGAVAQTINVNTSTTVTVTVTDGNGCKNSDTESVVVNQNPTPNITGINTICQGQNTTFNAGAYSSYNWSTGATTQTVSLNTAGNYTVTVTDANGCTGTDNYSLIVYSNPVPVISGNFTICSGDNTTLNAGGYTGYQWNTGATTQTISVGTAGPFTVTVTNGNGCTGTTSQAVIVNPLPTPNITGVASICQGQSTTLDAGAGYSNYQWSTGAVAQTINVNTTTTVTVTVTDANGCINSDSQNVVVNANPIPSITGNTVVCQGINTTLNAGAGYSGYLWSTGATSQTLNTGTAGPVTVTVTDGNGCTGTAVTSITVNAVPTASISGIDTICDGQASSFNINFAGAPGPYTYSYSAGGSTVGPLTTGAALVNTPVSPNTTTNYNLISISNNNCTGTISGTAQVAVIPLPTATLSGTAAICSGGSTNLGIAFTGNAPYTYTYTAGGVPVGPFTTNNSSVTIPVTPGATTTYGLTPVVSGMGCAGSTSGNAVVTVNALPSATIAGNNTICAGNTTDLTLNFVGTGPYTYSYSNGSVTYGPFTTSNNPETVTVSPGTSVIYNLLTVSDANCPGSVAGSANITVNPLPTAALSGTTFICDGASTNLQVLFTGTGPFNYSYSDGTNTFGPFTTNQNPLQIPVSPNTTTTYSLLNVNDANCVGSVSGVADINVIPLPTSTLSGSTSICNGSSTNMSLTFTGTPPFEYFYTDGSNSYGPFLTNNFNTTIPVNPTVSTSYSITSVTGSGCAGTPAGVVDIIVNDLPAATATLTGNGVICEGESSQVTVDFTGTSPFTYEYTDGSNVYGPFTTNNNSEVLPVSPVTTTTYSLVSVTDVNCPGSVSGTAQVIVNPLPTAAASASIAICDGSSTSFNINFTGTGPFTYTYSDGSTTLGPFTTSNNPEVINVTPTVTTSYSMLYISDANCVGTASGVVDVTVNQIPTGVIAGNSTICEGENTAFNLNFTGVAPFNYSYSDGNTTYGPFTTNNASNSITVSPSVTTNFTLVNLNDLNCPGIISGNVQVTVNPLPEPVITGDLAICDGETTELNATTGFITYDWSNGANQASILTGTGGIYTVTVTDQNGCSGTSPAVNLVVNAVPVVSFTNDTTLDCSIPSVTFTNTSTYDPGSVFEWDFGDGFTSGQANPSHVYDNPGLYQVSLIITTPAGCTNQLSQPVDVVFYPLADADFIADPNITNVFNARIQYTDLSKYAVSWLWEFGDGSTSTEQNPIHYFNDVGDYKTRLTVYNIAGCPDVRELPIVINPFYVPNAFTPNTDGINDYFFDAGYVLDVADFRMLIFNRWGQEVYEADNYNKFWNGEDNDGNEAPQGVYVYRIDVKTKGGKSHTFNGTVTLLR